MELIYEDLTDELIGCFFSVHRVKITPIRFYQTQLRADYLGVKALANAVGFVGEFRFAKK